MVLVLAVIALAPSVIRVTPPGFESAREPQIAIDVDHRIYIVYGKGEDILLSTSVDRGKSYGRPTKIASLPKLALGMRRGPRIAADKGALTVTAISHESGDLVAYRSTNQGVTWSTPVRINDVPASAREGLQALALAPDGTLASSWLDLRSAGTKLYMSTSKDGGKTWSQNRKVYESPSGSICECCHPSLAFDSGSKLYLMFRNSVLGSRNLYLTSTGDLGKTFTNAVKLGEGDWKINACPMDGGSIAMDDSGQVVATWRRENSIYKCGSNGRETLVGPGKQPWLTLGSFLIWTDDQQVTLAANSQRNQLGPGTDPVIVSSPDKTVVVGAWSDQGIVSTTIR